MFNVSQFVVCPASHRMFGFLFYPSSSTSGPECCRIKFSKSYWFASIERGFKMCEYIKTHPYFSRTHATQWDRIQPLSRRTVKIKYWNSTVTFDLWLAHKCRESIKGWNAIFIQFYIVLLPFWLYPISSVWYLLYFGDETDPTRVSQSKHTKKAEKQRQRHQRARKRHQTCYFVVLNLQRMEFVSSCLSWKVVVCPFNFKETLWSRFFLSRLFLDSLEIKALFLKNWQCFSEIWREIVIVIVSLCLLHPLFWRWHVDFAPHAWESLPKKIYLSSVDGAPSVSLIIRYATLQLNF